MLELSTKAIRENQHTRSINDATKVVYEVFKEMDKKKYIYPSSLKSDLLAKIREIKQRDS
jgi:hypothetical protein